MEDTDIAMIGHHQLNKKTGELVYVNHASFPIHALNQAIAIFNQCATHTTYYPETEEWKAICQVLVTNTKEKQLIVKQYFIAPETNRCIKVDLVTLNGDTEYLVIDYGIPHRMNCHIQASDLLVDKEFCIQLDKDFPTPIREARIGKFLATH